MTLLTFLTVLACIKPTPVPQATTATPVSVTAVLERMEDGRLEDAPALLVDTLVAALNARNLPAVPKTVPAGLAAGGGDRVEILTEASNTPLVMLAETRAAFFSEMSGQYRWTVSLRVTLIETSASATSRVEDIEIPVFLPWDHLGEADAVAAAAPQVARRVGEVLDAWVEGEE